MDVVLLGLPHKVSAHKVPEIMKTGARIVDLSGDFRLRDAAAYKKYYGAEHPSARAARRHVRLRPARAQPRRDQARRSTSRRRLLRDDDRARRSCRWRKRGPARRRRRGRRHHRLVGRRRRADGDDAPPDARGEPAHLQAARAPAHPRDHARRCATRARKRAAAALRAGARRRCRAASSRPASRTSTASATQGRDRAPRSPRPSAASRSCACRRSACPRSPRSSGSNYVEVGFAVGGDARPGTASARVTCFSVTDNLIKGGAGQAIQSMNIMLGVDEKATLEDPGSWP